MSAPIDEARLARIEARATDYATRCYACDAVARVVIPGTSRALCAACAPDVPGAVLPLVSSYADALDLVAEVRRLTAALAAHACPTDARCTTTHHPGCACHEARHASALEIARREGAEAMRAALIARFKGRVEYLRPWAEAEADENGCHAGAWTEALNAVQFTQEMALPLDAPGGGS